MEGMQEPPAGSTQHEGLDTIGFLPLQWLCQKQQWCEAHRDFKTHNVPLLTWVRHNHCTKHPGFKAVRFSMC